MNLSPPKSLFKGRIAPLPDESNPYLQRTPHQSHYLYINHAVSNFYGTEIEIWADFEPVGSTEIKILGRRPIMINF